MNSWSRAFSIILTLIYLRLALLRGYAHLITIFKEITISIRVPTNDIVHINIIIIHMGSLQNWEMLIIKIQVNF